MMEFWQENQGQSHLYSNFGTVPGRNCTHNYHDRHQSAHYPLYCGEQLDQSRESSYWTVPGSRTGGAPHEYTNWKDPEVSNASSSSSHFPFILDRNTQHHRDLGEYQPHEAKDREWTTAHRAARDYERGLREGWQRRWEPCSAARYNRESCAKRSDSSYRELEAWAARYSHSLPRRRRIEAELRGASQGLAESVRSGIDPQVAALQHPRQSANMRESGLWDRGVRQQAPTYYPSQNPNGSHMLDMKGNTSYQRRTFSQPPGYIAPPPYNSPQKNVPVLHHGEAGYEQDGKKQTYWSQPAQINQNISADLHDKRKVEKEVFTLPNESTTGAKFDGLKHQNQEASSPTSAQSTPLQHEPGLQKPEEVKSSKIDKEISSKVIEGRKFRLKKKTGGMTIFCLVSRKAGATESSTLPLRASQTNTESTEIEKVCKAPRATGEVGEVHEVADEVDCRAPTIKEQSKTSDVTPASTNKETLQDDLSNKEETEVVFPEKTKTNDFDLTFGRQVGQSASVKYPLWREPSFTSKADDDSEEKESVQNTSSHPIDIEVRRLDIKEDSEDGSGLLVIDTTCVVVKMELIPSPKKEHVQYLGSTERSEESPSDIETAEVNQDVTTDQNTDTTPLQTNESLEMNLASALLEKEELDAESEISVPCMTPSPIPRGETLQERAERILGIPLHDCIPEQQPADATSGDDLRFDEQLGEEEAEPSPTNNYVHNAPEQTETEEATDEDQSQNHLEVVQAEVCLRGSDVSSHQGTSEEVEELAATSEENDSQLETSMEIIEEPLLESTGEGGTSEQEENPPVEDDQSSRHSCDSSPLSHFTPPSFISDADEGTEETSSLPPPQTPSPQLPSPLPVVSPDYSPSPPPPLDLADETAEVMSSEVQDEEAEASQLTENEADSASAATDTTEEVLSSQQHLEYDRTDDAYCVTDERQMEEAEEEPAVEQNLETSEGKAVDAKIILQQHIDCVPREDALDVEESNMTEEQAPTEVSEDPPDLSGQTPETDDDATDGLTEVSILPQPFDCSQDEEALRVTESGMTESHKDPDELHEGVWEQQASCKDEATDSETLGDPEAQTEPSIASTPSASACEVPPLDEHSPSEHPSPPHASLESDTECVSLSDLDSVCPLTLNPDSAAAAGVPATVPPPLFPDSCEEPLQFSSPPTSDSPPPPLQQNVNLPPDFLTSAHDKETTKYPKSLWDVVNRIRKHTAPDSENEEEDGGEPWDPENVGEALGCPDVVVDTNTENIIFDEAEWQEVSKYDGEMELSRRDDKRPSGDEDTLSCSSASSHGSGGTIVVANEDEDEELDATTECKTETEDFHTAEEELCCSGEVKGESRAEEHEEKDGADMNECCQSEECSREEAEGKTETENLR